jgi:peptide-methionine (S)-S-oxide reductase
MLRFLSIQIIIIFWFSTGCSGAAPTTIAKNTAKTSNQYNETMDTLIVGGGCFWCTEAVFESLKGVEQVTSGYAGGNIINPSYREVCSGRTGHAEVVEIIFNPDEISLYALLEVFFKTHDPTTLNRQGADAGTQYRSVIFYRNDTQRIVAEEVIGKLETAAVFSAPIVTEISPFKNFFTAEPEHQEYYFRNSGQGYCRVVIAPKLEKLKEVFSEWLK